MDNRKKAGVLQPIPIPERAWQQITTNLGTDLPESKGKTTIVVSVDRLTKMTHLVLCTKDVPATQYVRLFVDNAFWLHGMPEVIISDRFQGSSANSRWNCFPSWEQISGLVLHFILKLKGGQTSPFGARGFFAAVCGASFIHKGRSAIPG